MHVLLVLLAVQQPVPPPASPVSDTAHVVIVATTDVHGRVLGWDYVRDAAAPGGLSRAATVIETLRAQYPDRVVLVDAGDLIEGNLFAGYFAERDSQRPHPVWMRSTPCSTTPPLLGTTSSISGAPCWRAPPGTPRTTTSPPTSSGARATRSCILPTWS